MKHKCILLLIALLAHSLGAAEKPNIILILCDDLGYGDLGVTGHPYVNSPNIDQLASEGIIFDHGYMSGAWCAPSRYSLMSGIYPSRYFQDTKEMDTEAPNLFRVLKSVGYTTAHFGKWHMSGRATDDPTPDMYGVDEDFIANGNGEGWTREERRAPHWRENTTERYVDLTIDYMEKQKDSEQPFFINLWVYPTHSYIDPRPDMLEPYKDLEVDINDFENPLMREFLHFIADQGDVQEAMRAYCSDVTELDNHVGRLMQAIKNLGLDEETMVIFASDNGPPPLGGVDNLDQLAERIKERPTLINCVGSAGPYRDRKISLHEGGVRTPLFVRWPGKIPAGQVNTETVFTGVDFLPTLATLTGAEIPAGIDGISLLSSWAGQQIERGQPHFWNDRPGWSTLRDKQWKAHLKKKEFRLFDILEDPSESNEVSSQFPEISDQYRKLLEQFEATLPSSKKR
ncbi:MAG: sulfatase-like hydrolase/transferase [Verrucomicrobiota bacterium]